MKEGWGIRKGERKRWAVRNGIVVVNMWKKKSCVTDDVVVMRVNIGTLCILLVYVVEMWGVVKCGYTDKVNENNHGALYTLLWF